MIWAFTSILTVILVELFLRLPLIETAIGIGETARRAMRTLRARGASDHWKEKASQAYAVRMFRATLVLAACLGLIAAVGAILTIGMEKIVPGFGAALLSWSGLIVSLAVATLYMVARSYRVARSRFAGR